MNVNARRNSSAARVPDTNLPATPPAATPEQESNAVRSGSEEIQVQCASETASETVGSAVAAVFSTSHAALHPVENLEEVQNPAEILLDQVTQMSVAIGRYMAGCKERPILTWRPFVGIEPAALNDFLEAQKHVSAEAQKYFRNVQSNPSRRLTQVKEATLENALSILKQTSDQISAESRAVKDAWFWAEMDFR